MTNHNHQVDKTALGVLSTGHLIIDAYGGFILPIMPLIAAKLNISLGIVGLLLGISSISSSILQPFFGYISDLIHKRFFIFWGVIFSSLFISLTGLSDNIWVLAALIFLGSMGVGLFHPQASAFAGLVSGHEINKYMGIFSSAGTIGYALGPFLSSILVDNFGLGATIYAFIPGVIITYLMFTTLPKIPIVKTQAKEEGTRLSQVFKLDKVIYILLFISIIRAIVVTSFHVFMPFVWAKQGLPIILVGILIASFSFMGGIASYIGGRLSNLTDKRLIMLVSMLPATPLLLGSLFLLKSMPIVSFILFVLTGLAIMSSNSVNLVMGQEAAPLNAGLVSGLIGGFSWGVGGLLQSPIGFLSTTYGITTVLAVIALIPILGALSVAYISREYA